MDLYNAAQSPPKYYNKGITIHEFPQFDTIIILLMFDTQ